MAPNTDTLIRDALALDADQRSTVADFDEAVLIS